MVVENENDVTLLPCPFCGGEATLLHFEIFSVNTGWSVECLNILGCEVKPGTSCFQDQRQAIEAWNARAERTCKPIDSERCLSGTDCPAWLCSECGELFEEETNFCSNCGAKVVENGS